MDLNLDNYSEEECLQILGLGDYDELTSTDVLNACQRLIHRFTYQTPDEEIKQFFIQMRDRIFFTDEEEDEEGENERGEQVGDNKEEEEEEGFETMGQNQGQAPEQQQQQPKTITTTTNVEFAPGQINPTLRQTTSAILLIDSRYREDKNDPATNFTFTLSTPLKYVLSMKLYSCAIPYAWYTVDTAYGSNFILLRANSPGINNGNHDFKISIKSGNYTAAELITSINTSLQATMTEFDPSNTSSVTYSASEAIATINLNITKTFNELDYRILFGGLPTNNIASFLGITTSNNNNNQNKLISTLYGSRNVTLSNTAQRLTQYNITTGNNNFWIYITNDGAAVTDTTYDAVANLTIDLSYNISIPTGTYDINGIQTAINQAFQTIPALNTSQLTFENIQQQDTITTGLPTFDIYVTKLTAKSNYRTTLYFPPAATSDLASILTFTADKLYPIQYIYPSTSITSNRYVIFNNNDETDPQLNNIFYLNCIKPGFLKQKNNYTLTLNPSDAIGYTTSDLIAEFKAAFATINANTETANQMNGSNATVDSAGKMNLLINIQKTFTQKDYVLDIDGNTFFATNQWFSTPTISLSTGNPAVILTNTITPGNISSNDVSGVVLFYFTPISTDQIDPVINKIAIMVPGQDYTFAAFIAAINAAIATIGSALTGTTVQIVSINAQQIKLQLNININVSLTEKDYQLVFPSYLQDQTNLYNIIQFPQQSSITEDTPLVSINPIDSGTFDFDVANNNNTILLQAVTDGVSTTNGTHDILITIDPTNTYTQEGLINEIQRQMDQSPLLNGSKIFIKKLVVNETTFYYVYMSVVVNKIFTESDYSMVLYDPTIYIQCNAGSKKNTVVKKDTTLGWICGFRENSYLLSDYISSTRMATIRASAPVDVAGPSYLYIVLDDFTQNHMNNSVITVHGSDALFQMPSKSYGDFIYTCDPDTGEKTVTAGNSQNSARRLTQRQLYSLNSILNVRTNQLMETKEYSYATSTKDILAYVPIKSGMSGTNFVEYGGTLQAQTRSYFGPVNIVRINVKLVNSKGDIVNLNNVDWSFSVIVEMLYQNKFENK